MRQFLFLCLIGFVASQTTTIQQEKNLLDWIQGLLGGSTTSSPIVNDPPVIEPEECSFCKCGISNTKRRIVGGSETNVTQYPWIAALLFGNRFYCAATVINTGFAVTAAHCVSGFRKERITIRLLEHDRSIKNETETLDVKVAEIIRHPRYSPSTFDNDIALLKFDRKLKFSSAVKSLVDDNNDTDGETNLRPVCLPEKGLSYSNYTGVVTGWGTTEEGGSVSNTLQEVKVPILSNVECRQSTYKNRITDNMICAGVPEGGKDACQGDSGGPMHVQVDDVYQLVGVVSWGEGCARPNTPGVYSRVNRYLTWMKTHTSGACDCS